MWMEDFIIQFDVSVYWIFVNMTFSGKLVLFVYINIISIYYIQEISGKVGVGET